MIQRTKAERFNGEGLALRDAGDLDGAIEKYRLAISADPGWSVPLYNAGLVCKYRRQWVESLEYNQRASVLNPKDPATWWNLGIAATALGRWDVARAAWRSFGIRIPAGKGPLDLPCGSSPIRLNPEGDAEVVWADRIDPARAILISIPLPESKHRWGDTILNDGAPTGYRKHDGTEYPVFDELALLEPSSFGTYVARVKVPSETRCVQKLAELAAEMEGSAEDWTTSTRMLCKACSEGRPHEMHDTAAVRKPGAHSIGIAARSRAHAEEILSAWESRTPGVSVEWLADALEPS